MQSSTSKYSTNSGILTYKLYTINDFSHHYCPPFSLSDHISICTIYATNNMAK